MTGVMKSIYLCADDYAQNTPISEGILTLLEAQKINAASCLVTASQWTQWGKCLQPFTAENFIGLHLNLTYGTPLSAAWQKKYGVFRGLPHVLMRCYSRQWDKQIIEIELQAQLNHFMDVMGCFPKFIDGHEHIHQLPVIRNVLLKLLKGYPPTFFCRSTTTQYTDLLNKKAFPKRQLIALLGGLSFQRLLVKHHLPHNTHFAGIYDFKKAKQYRTYFQNFLKMIRPSGLIMCHPGLKSQDKTDPLSAFRSDEFNYFMSEDYAFDKQFFNVQLYRRAY